MSSTQYPAKSQQEHTSAQSENSLLSGDKKITVLNRMIPNTPFMGRYEKEHGWSYGIAGQRISKWYESEELMLKAMKKGGIDWNKLSAIIMILVDAEINRREIIKKSDN